MTTQLEDRLRHYGTTLDHAALASAVTAEATDDVDATVIIMPLRPSLTGVRNRRRVLALAAAAASLLLITAGIWAVNGRHANDDAAQVGSAPAADRPLLVPPGTTPNGVPIVAPPGRHTVVVTSPSGANYSIELYENSWGRLPEGSRTRVIDGHAVGVFGDTYSNTSTSGYAYGVLDQCSMTITRSPSKSQWDSEVLALLGAETFDNGVVTVELPTGWTTVVPPGTQVSSFDHTINTGVEGRSTSVVSAPNGTAATIFGLYGRPAKIQRADFDGHTAWYSTYPASNDGTNAHLTWEAAGNAYDITARDATQDQLIAFARKLVPMSIADFVSTNPDQSSGATVGSTAPAPVDGCPTRSLTVTSAAG